ncbi:MAG: hypothetical protein HQ536_00130 [Parcubacteria group bacterium]|nr:hypothetical protein [Parcubacteria group bacterium]
MTNINKDKKQESTSNLDEDIKELVTARLNVLSQDTCVSIGSEGSFNRQELIEHVEQGSEVGKKIIEINMKFLQSLKKGELYE